MPNPINIIGVNQILMGVAGATSSTLSLKFGACAKIDCI